jgi:8-oxo-dGTP pyrophosphatase MutT (NUDIX family)
MTAAVHENGSFGLVRSYKRGLDGIDVQPPAGIVDPGEIPLDTAKRELLEELGCEASVWHALGEYITDGNFGMSRAYFFLAEGCRETRTPEPGDLEEQQVLWLSREQVWESWSHGAFHQLSTMACLGVAFAHLDGRLDGPAGFAPSAPGEK